MKDPEVSYKILFHLCLQKITHKGKKYISLESVIEKCRLEKVPYSIITDNLQYLREIGFVSGVTPENKLYPIAMRITKSGEKSTGRMITKFKRAIRDAENPDIKKLYDKIVSRQGKARLHIAGWVIFYEAPTFFSNFIKLYIDETIVLK